MLASLGYLEQITWSFMDKKLANVFVETVPALEIARPISQDLNYLRPNNIGNLLAIIHNNINRSIDSQAYFEIGPSFSYRNGQIQENKTLTLVATGFSSSINPHQVREKYNFFSCKSHIEILFQELNLDWRKFDFTTQVPDYYHPYRSSTIKLGKNIIGYIGNLHPNSIKKYNIKEEVIAIEILLENLPPSKTKNKKLFQPSLYQKVTRDFSFLFDQQQEIGKILCFIKKLDNIIESVDIFDVYENLANENKKSVSFTLTLQPIFNTLNNEQLQNFQDNIIKQVENKFGGILR